MSTLVVGIDPGLTTGLFAIKYPGDCDLPAGHAVECRSNGPIAAQIHGSEGVVPFVETLLARNAAERLIAIEQFVVGARAARSSSAHAGRVTRALVTEVSRLANDLCVDVFTRSAAMVKPWATDKRLDAAGLLQHCTGMGHARDAARHALYAAVHCGLLADPLSRKAAAR